MSNRVIMLNGPGAVGAVAERLAVALLGHMSPNKSPWVQVESLRRPLYRGLTGIYDLDIIFRNGIDDLEKVKDTELLALLGQSYRRALTVLEYHLEKIHGEGALAELFIARFEAKALLSSISIIPDCTRTHQTTAIGRKFLPDNCLTYRLRDDDEANSRFAYIADTSALGLPLKDVKFDLPEQVVDVIVEDVKSKWKDIPWQSPSKS